MLQSGNWDRRGKDNGVLVVVAKDDRAYRIEVGYGLEGVLPDGFCGTVGRSYFVSKFQKGQFSEGIYQGIVVLVNKIAEENGIKITGMPSMADMRKKANEHQNPYLSLLFLLILFPFLLNFLFNRRRTSSYWWGGPPIIFEDQRGSVRAVLADLEALVALEAAGAAHLEVAELPVDGNKLNRTWCLCGKVLGVASPRCVHLCPIK